MGHLLLLKSLGFKHKITGIIGLYFLDLWKISKFMFAKHLALCLTQEKVSEVKLLMYEILTALKLKVNTSNKGIRNQYKLMVSWKCVKWLDFKKWLVFGYERSKGKLLTGCSLGVMANLWTNHWIWKSQRGDSFDRFYAIIPWNKFARGRKSQIMKHSERQKEEFEFNMVDRREPFSIFDQRSKMMKLVPYKISLSKVCKMDWRREKLYQIDQSQSYQ